MQIPGQAVTSGDQARLCDVFEMLVFRLEGLEAWAQQDVRVRMHADNIASAGSNISGLLHCGRPARIIKHYSGEVQPGSLVVAHGSHGPPHAFLPVLFFRATNAITDLASMIRHAEFEWEKLMNCPEPIHPQEIEFFIVPERSEATADFLEDLVRLVNGSDGEASLIAQARASWSMLPDRERNAILECHDPHEFLQHDVMCYFIM